MTDLFRYLCATVREINQKYATPDIGMSRAVKFSLLMLRLYLILLILLSIYKFVTLLK
jgi:hypothetical protein